MICEVFTGEEQVEAMIKILCRSNGLPWAISFVSSASNTPHTTCRDSQSDIRPYSFYEATCLLSCLLFLSN